MSNNKKKHQHKPKPKGMSYADVLSQKKQAKEAIEKLAYDKTLELRVNINSQRMTWLMVCSVADAFGVGPKRMQQFFDAFQKNLDDFDRMTEETDAEYANEKLRQRAEQASGMDISYLYEAEMKLARERNEAMGVFFDKQPELAAPVELGGT